MFIAGLCAHFFKKDGAWAHLVDRMLDLIEISTSRTFYNIEISTSHAHTSECWVHCSYESVHHCPLGLLSASCKAGEY